MKPTRPRVRWITGACMWAVITPTRVVHFLTWAAALAYANDVARIVPKVSYSSTGSWLPERRDRSDS